MTLRPERDTVGAGVCEDTQGQASRWLGPWNWSSVERAGGGSRPKGRGWGRQQFPWAALGRTWLLLGSDLVGRGWSLRRAFHLLPQLYRMSCVYGGGLARNWDTGATP